MSAMTQPVPSNQIRGQWTLPPLILHPFSEDESPKEILEGSRASLMLNGLLPGGGKDREALNLAIMRGRAREMRMLFFLGRDLMRWIDQCMDFVTRTSELSSKGLGAQSFAAFMVENPPDSITEKLRIWGVTDRKSVFSRALAINSLLNQPPTAESLSPVFLQNYHRFLDYQFICFQNLEPFTEIGPANFEVQMYASAEYSQMLAEQWAKE
jgi:hypothetical protein